MLNEPNLASPPSAAVTSFNPSRTMLSNPALPRRWRTDSGSSPRPAWRMTYFVARGRQRWSSGIAKANSIIRRSWNGCLPSRPARAHSRSFNSAKRIEIPRLRTWYIVRCAKPRPRRWRVGAFRRCSRSSLRAKFGFRWHQRPERPSQQKINAPLPTKHPGRKIRFVAQQPEKFDEPELAQQVGEAIGAAAEPLVAALAGQDHAIAPFANRTMHRGVHHEVRAAAEVAVTPDLGKKIREL